MSLAGRARELVAAGLPAERYDEAARRGRTRHLASAKALAREELGATVAAAQDGDGRLRAT